MTFAGSVRTCLSNYATFSGRATRSEYWYFVLFFFIGSLVCGLVDQLVFGVRVVEVGEVGETGDGPVGFVFGLTMFLPLLAAGWRRMHDTGRSGLLLLYPLIVMIGIVTFAGLMGGFAPLFEGDFAAVVAGGMSIVIAISLIVLFLSPLVVIWWLASPSEPGANDHGPNPQEVIR